MKLLLATAAGILLVASDARADYKICAPAGDKLRFDVSFGPGSQWENGVKIIEDRSGQPVATFNNFFGKGAGEEWKKGNGDHSVITGAQSTCYTVVGMAKYGPPNGNVSWNTSKHVVRTAPDGAKIVRFEDGADQKYNDATVRIHTISAKAFTGLALEGTNLCAPVNRRIRFDVKVNPASTWENSVRLYAQDGREVANFNNYFRRGAGSEWKNGSGSYETTTSPKHRCFAIKGQAKYSPPNGNVAWHDSQSMITVANPTFSRVRFEDGGNNNYNDAVVTVTLW